MVRSSKCFWPVQRSEHVGHLVKSPHHGSFQTNEFSLELVEVGLPQEDPPAKPVADVFPEVRFHLLSSQLLRCHEG